MLLYGCAVVISVINALGGQYLLLGVRDVQLRVVEELALENLIRFQSGLTIGLIGQLWLFILMRLFIFKIVHIRLIWRPFEIFISFCLNRHFVLFYLFVRFLGVRLILFLNDHFGFSFDRAHGEHTCSQIHICFILSFFIRPDLFGAPQIIVFEHLVDVAIFVRAFDDLAGSAVGFCTLILPEAFVLSWGSIGFLSFMKWCIFHDPRKVNL